MTNGKVCAALCTGVLWTLCATGQVRWYAVDPMAETPFMPNQAPQGGREGAPVTMVAAKGEYEPGSFVLVSDEDIGRVEFEISDLKRDEGRGKREEGNVIFPKAKIDLKTVKVWYQAGNAWTSYFADPKLRLIPELLLNDEDLIKVDTKKGWNYARLTEADGRVAYRWLNPSRAVTRAQGPTFHCMKPNFCDAKTHQGATLKKGEYKQFWLTVEVGKDVKAGVYRGEVKVKGEGEQWNVPLALKVLDFELPEPKCYFDVEKDFLSYFCEYVGLEIIRGLNGGDAKLAERQLLAILKDFVRHNEVTPCYRDKILRSDIGKAAGMRFDENILAGGMHLGEPVEMRYQARVKKRQLVKRFGEGRYLLGWGDEFGLTLLRGVRDMVEIYEEEGFRWPINSHVGYQAAGYLADLWWPPYDPDGGSSEATFKYNQLGGDGYMGWYASQHVGSENPAFNRRQYGIGPYRAGFSCNYNYAHHLDEWNDIEGNLYRSMNFVYGTGDGCVDTIQWEGFREGIDDIRYATKLKQLADRHLKGGSHARHAAKKALQLLADADGDDMDLTTLRLEMIRHIENLMKLEAK